LELHGNLARTRCSRACGLVERWDEAGPVPPVCRRCGAPLRPDVVWFGEALPHAALGGAFAAAASADVFLSVGTSALVQPAASLPLEARDHGAMVVEINPEATPLTPHAALRLAGPAGLVLPALLAATWPPAA
jgi:NAD-dependent deacetylase